MVLDFFKNLVRYRVEGVRSKAQAKVYGAKARAQSKVAGKFNKAVDAPMKKAQSKAKGMGKKKKGGKADKKKKPDKKADKKAAKEKKESGGGGGGGGGGGKQKKDDGKKGGKVGLFNKNKKSSGGGSRPRVEPPEEVEFDPGMKTQAIDISSMVDDRAQDVVGWVVCLNGALRGRDFRLVTGRNVMGTAADCDIVLTDPYLSSKHMAIRHEDGRFMLIDLDSTNGTFVNDRRATKTELIDNDKIRLGRTELKFKSLF